MPAQFGAGNGSGGPQGSPDSDSPHEEERPIIRDRRKLDPQTGEVRHNVPDAAPSASGTPAPAAASSSSANVGEPSAEVTALQAELIAAQSQAAERLEDLQRVQAEYVNYRKRVDRDRAVAGELAVAGVLESMIPILDEIEMAREHGELTGPFEAMATKLELTLEKFGWQRYGQAGEEFDPNVHEALMHSHSNDVSGPTVTQVLQPGYRVGDRILRAARVAVSEPEE